MVSIFFHGVLFGYQYDLALCALFRDEAPYLKEWIEFHRLVGVEHFYLYNHCSRDQYKQVLAPYVKENVVEVINWSYEPLNLFHFNDIQTASYNHCLARIKHRVRWLIVLDTDEFLFPVQELNLKELLLREYGGAVSIGINWNMFGTSFVNALDEKKPLIEQLTLRAALDDPCQLHVKTIVRPEYVAKFSNPHYPELLRGFHTQTPEGTPFSGPRSPVISSNILRINHYWTRDRTFFETVKLKRRFPLNKTQESEEQIALLFSESLNSIQDTTIQKYLEPLNARLSQENAPFSHKEILLLYKEKHPLNLLDPE